MRIHCSIRNIAAFFLISAMLTGCSRSPRVMFYTLNAAATPESAALARESVTIGPVTLPDLLDRPQLVVRTSANQVDILETHRWAESLKSEIPRIIAGNLDILLKPARISTYPQSAGADAGYRVMLDIQRLEMTEGKGVALDALWSIRRVEDGVLKSGRSAVSEPVGVVGYDPLVAAQNRALLVVSRDIAQGLRSMVLPPEVK